MAAALLCLSTVAPARVLAQSGHDGAATPKPILLLSTSLDGLQGTAAAPAGAPAQAAMSIEPTPAAAVARPTAIPPAPVAIAATTYGPPAAVPATRPSPEPPAAGSPVLRLGVGDAVTVSVFGRPEFNTTAYVSEDQTILVPLAGPVRVGGLSPADAAIRVANALRDGQFLVNPQVSVNFSQFRSQQISVLGEINTPGRFPIESKTSILDLLAQAGGVKETAADDVVLIRTQPDGSTQRQRINLKKLVTGTESVPVDLRGGDSLFVPRAEQYYIYGEVHSPNMYKLESDMTVIQAISRSGGLTDRGSDRRIEIKRQMEDGKYKTFDAGIGDPIKPNDVIRVKERIF